jgi:hypothetical protein
MKHAEAYIRENFNGGGERVRRDVPNLGEWIGRKIAPRDLLCGSFLSTTCRIIITGPTGLGKTMLGIAVAMALAAGRDFLHWKAHRAARVLYVDGEMPRELMQERLIDECLRAGVEPDNFFILSKEDFEDMPPLNTPEGQQWMDEKVEAVKPDMIFFDNIQALVVGDHGKEESWTPLLPWIGSLTKRCIGQIWFHHTGHNEGHSYGTKTREWKMDTHILMERVPDTEDLTFTLRFTKARMKRPDNREEYADVTLALVNDRWTSSGAARKKGGRPPGAALLALDALKRGLAEGGEKAPGTGHYPADKPVLKVSVWERYCRQMTITSADNDKAFKAAFERSAKRLQTDGLIGVWGEFVWAV